MKRAGHTSAPAPPRRDESPEPPGLRAGIQPLDAVSPPDAALAGPERTSHFSTALLPE